ncbi:hypothetical protein, partial [Flavobacterium sp.]|uniref:hypothetical protein n=1 Tax=Flavobacterium sp. TaxID=239 RepID=UPI002869FE5A
MSISNAAQIVRPQTPMTFTAKTQYNTAENLTGAESGTIKWNLNGIFVGTGATIKLEGGFFIREGKYVIEGYVHKANASVHMTGKEIEATNQDDWHFEVKKNDVIDFGFIGMPKVGKKTQLTVTQYVLPPIEGEKTIWTIFGKTVLGQTIDITPATAGSTPVVCKINYMSGKKQPLIIKQAVVDDVVFTDSSGIEIKKASWGSKINMFVKQKELIDEDFVVDLVSQADNKPALSKTVAKYNGGLLPIALDSSIKSKSAGATSFYLKINAPHLKAIGEDTVFPKGGRLEITDVRSIFKGQLGEENASQKHTMVDYDKISWFYANTTGIKPDEELTIEIWQALTAKESFLGRDDKMKHTLKAKVDDSGVLKAKIEWNKIQKIKDTRQIYIQVKDKDGNTLYDADGKYNEAKVTLVYTPT